MGFENILNPNYKPSTQEDTDVFNVRNQWLYSVLTLKVKTDEGEIIVQEFEHTQDAQKAYAKLKSHHLRSTNAKMEFQSLLNYLTSARLGTGQWGGSTVSFLAQ